MHVPFEDKEAYGLACSVTSDLKPDRTILLGDYADFYNLSRYLKSPVMKRETFQDEIEGVEKRLSTLKEFSGQIVWIEGNHEHRFKSYVSERCPELFDFVDLKDILKLEEKGIKWIPYSGEQKFVVNDYLIARHESVYNAGVNATRMTIKETGGYSLIFGHTHKLNQFYQLDLFGKEIVGINAGCLCDRYHPALSYLKNPTQFQHGFVLVYTFDDGTFHEILVSIRNGRCIVNGQVYSTKDLTKYPLEILPPVVPKV